MGKFSLGTVVCAAALAPQLVGAAEHAAAASSNPAAVQELPQVLVIGNAPLPGFGLPLNEIPSNVQTADSQDLQRTQANDVADYLTQKFSGVNANASADNPFQLDINYHGFTASPLKTATGDPSAMNAEVGG